MATSFHRLGSRLGQGACRRLQHWLNVSNTKEAAYRQPWFQSIHTNAPLLATIPLDMPSLSPTMEKGNIIKWHKKEGDTVSPGDILCDIETDKATMSMDTEEEGILAKIIMPDNSQDVNVGTLICILVEEGEDWKNVEVPAKAASAAAPEPAKAPPPTPSAAAPASASHSGEIEQGRLIGPAVKKLLTEYNLSSSAIKSTGHGGALLKSDVLSYIEANKVPKAAPAVAASPPPPPPSAAPVKAAPAPVPSSSTDYVDIPLSNMRRVIAKRLTESKASIPHAYCSIDSDMGAVIALRKSLIAEGVKISVNDFIIKASAMALQRVPRVNAIWAGENSQLCPTVDISVAVATPNGLITPIVRGVGSLSVDQIGETVKANYVVVKNLQELAGRAKEGKLQPNEFQGGSFTISNLGMFGVKEFTAVINPPQVAIMAVGGSRPVAVPGGAGLKMTVTLSFDSRALDEVDVTRFLMEFRHVLENPQSMLAGTGLDAEAEAFAF